MALDHERDYTSAAAMSFSPTDLTRTTAALFLTRWVTHICAPVFAFTAGIGAFFWQRHGRSTSELSRFLVTRGLWLMLLEVTVLRFILFFEWRFHGGVYTLTVFWMLGLSMVGLAHLSPHKSSRAAQPCLPRALNRYGDPARWSTGSAPLFTALSFLNTTKNPPSLLFLLMTVGPALITLALSSA